MITDRTLKLYRGQALLNRHVLLITSDKDQNISILKDLVEKQARVIIRLTSELMDINLMKSK